MQQPISGEHAKRITINSYNDQVEEYVEKDSTDDVRTLAYWPGVQYFLDQLSQRQKILEIGSGTGADARRIESQGFDVQRTDIAEAFLNHMRSNGFNASYLDILEGIYEEQQTAVFANAVFLHFTSEQFQTATNNVLESLEEDGLFCIGMKLGDFEGWREKGLSGKRFFKFWQLDDLRSSLEDAGFELMHSFTTPNEDFVVITARKSRAS